MEADEISEFSKQMREAGEHSLTHVSFIISVLAVLVAMVTVLSHRAHTEAVLAQARSSDQWGEYQARRIRQFELGMAADQLNLYPAANAAKASTQLNRYAQMQSRLQGQLHADSDKAHELEAEVEVAEQKAARFDLGEALLQIGVVLASVTLLTRQRRYVVVALALGLSGLIAAGLGVLVR